MSTAFYRTLGAKLRSYRKTKHLTLKDLSTALNKSLATVGKYETGEIAPDLETLVTWCTYLNVDLGGLLPSTCTIQDSAYLNRYQNHFIDRLYIYYFKGGENKIHTCVIENDNQRLTAILYYDVKSVENIYESTFIYHGNVRYSDTATSFVFFNTEPPFDMLTFSIPFLQNNDGYRIGLFSTISFFYQRICTKAVASEYPIINLGFLCDTLQTTAKDVKEIRKANCFIL